MKVKEDITARSLSELRESLWEGVSLRGRELWERRRERISWLGGELREEGVRGRVREDGALGLLLAVKGDAHLRALPHRVVTSGEHRHPVWSRVTGVNHRAWALRTVAVAVIVQLPVENGLQALKAEHMPASEEDGDQGFIVKAKNP